MPQSSICTNRTLALHDKAQQLSENRGRVLGGVGLESGVGFDQSRSGQQPDPLVVPSPLTQRAGPVGNFLRPKLEPATNVQKGRRFTEEQPASCGLLGFFHRPHCGRPSLAFDLAGEFRPIIADSATMAT